MRSQLGDGGVIDIIAAALRKFVRNPAVVHHTFDALGGLCLTHPTNTTRILAASLVKPMIIAANMHKTAANVAVMFFQVHIS